MPRFLPVLRATRWRVAFFAVLSSAVAFAAGAFWFVGSLQDDLVNAARAEAASRVVAVRSLLDAGLSPAEVARRLPDGHYVIQSANRPNMTNCPDDPAATPVEIGSATVYPPDCVLGQATSSGMQYQDGGTGQGGKFCSTPGAIWIRWGSGPWLRPNGSPGSSSRRGRC